MNQITIKLLFALLTVGVLLSAASCVLSRPQTGTAPAPTCASDTQPPTVQTIPTAATVPPPQTAPQEERFVLSFAGDCTLGSNPTNYYAQMGFIQTVGDDYGYPFRNVLHYLEDDDLTLVNLEGPLCDTGNPVQKKHAFHGPTRFVNILTQNSVDAVTIANNHTFDYGQQGYDATLSALESAGIPYVQRDASTVITLERGLTVGIYGAVYYLLDVEDMARQISTMKQQGVDLVIFAPHWGTEGTYRPTQQQIDVGHAAIDAGADIVFGTHPHVLQPIESYGGGIIFYSLGNFSFGGNGYPRDSDTVLVQQTVVRGADGALTLESPVLIPACVSSVEDRNNFQPTPYDPQDPGYTRVLEKLAGTWQGPNLKIG